MKRPGPMPLPYGLRLSVEGCVADLLELTGVIIPRELQIRLLSPLETAGGGVLDVADGAVGPTWKTVDRMLGLEQADHAPQRALSYASTTVPIEGLVPSPARCSVNGSR